MFKTFRDILSEIGLGDILTGIGIKNNINGQPTTDPNEPQDPNAPKPDDPNSPNQGMTLQDFIEQQKKAQAMQGQKAMLGDIMGQSQQLAQSPQLLQYLMQSAPPPSGYGQRLNRMSQALSMLGR